MSAKASMKKSRSYQNRSAASGNAELSPYAHWLSLGRAGGRGMLASLIALLLLCTAGAAIAFATTDPDTLVTPIALCVTLLSSLVGGLVSYRSHRRAPLLCGLLCGLCFLLAAALIGLLLPDAQGNRWPESLQWGLRGGVLGFAALGSVLGSYAPKKKRRKKR